jgi:hypothetical protein
LPAGGARRLAGGYVDKEIHIMRTEDVLALAARSGTTPIGVCDVAAALRISHRQAMSALHHLYKGGRLTRIGKRKPHRYALPEPAPDVTLLPLPFPRHRGADPLPIAAWTGPYLRI